MTTVYLSEDAPVVDYSHVMDFVLLNLRKELRTDLSQISDIKWTNKNNALNCPKNKK